MPAELLSLDSAAALVEDGMTIAFGGLSLYRRPVSFVRALLRRDPRPRNLTLACFTAGFESDLLIGAGCVSTVRTVYFGLEAFGFAPMFTELAGRGDLTVIEETEASFALGLRARAAGIGFLPSRAWLGTDLPRLRPDVKTVDDPYSGEKLMAFPALQIDVAVLHGLAADSYGNLLLNNNLGVDLELCAAADCVIATVEATVDLLMRDRDGFILPAPASDHITLAPNGAYPTSCYPKYPIHGGELMRYVDACSAGAFTSYLDRFIHTEG